MGCHGQPWPPDHRCLDVQPAFEAGVRWLRDSGLWEDGLVRWGWRAGSFRFCYTEVTAYGLLLLLRLDPSADRVEATARRLLEAQDSSGAFLHHPGADESFTFDTAICVAALAELAQRSGDPALRAAALDGGRWLLGAQKESGSFRARYVPSSRAFARGDGAGTFWGDDSAIHAKASIALLQCERLEPGAGFAPAAARVCEWVTSLQRPNGRIRTCATSDETYLHAHCYAVEGLLVTSQVHTAPDLRRAADAGLSWLWHVQRKNGGLPAWRPKRRRPTMSAVDATAQAVRLWLASGEATHENERLRRAVRYLVRMQSRSGAREIAGGFRAASYGPWPLLFRQPVYPAWTSMFAVHALHMYCRQEQGHRPDPEELF